MDTLRTPEVEDLLTVLTTVKNPDVLYALLLDLFTVREIKDVSQRLAVVQMLDQGLPYLAIAEKTGASATTIARVSKCLNYGSGGYRAALDILNADGPGRCRLAEDGSDGSSASGHSAGGIGLNG